MAFRYIQYCAALAILCGIATRACGRAPADDAMADEPYQLSVVMRYSDDPIFTRYFKEATDRQVHDQLAAYFGRLVNLAVVRDHSLLKKFSSVALRDVAASPELFADSGRPEKVVVIDLDRRQNLYEIRWRHFDTDVWRVGPFREQTTPDRQWVAKAVCRAVTRDFEPVGRLEPSSAGRVELVFRGEAWPKELNRQLAAPCVLLAVRVEKQRDGSIRHEPIADTALILDKHDGSWHATVHSGVADPWRKSARVEGFQAIKASTATGRIRLRLIDSVTGAPALGFTIHAAAKGFHPDIEGQLLGAPDRFGYVVSSQTFSDLAYLTISQGGGAAFRVPLPITGPWCESVFRLPVDKKAAEKNDFERRLRLLGQDVRALQVVLEQQVHEVNELNHAKRYEEAFSRVKQALTFISPLRQTLEREEKKLQVLADDGKKSVLARLASAVEATEIVARREGELDALAANLQQAIAKNDAQSRANVLLDLAKQAENDANIDEALDKYTQALAEQPDQPAIKKYLADMQETWRIKGPEHQRARGFVTDKWPVVPVTELAANWAAAEKAFEALKASGDYLTALKLLKVNQLHVEELANLNSQIAADSTEGNRAEQEKFAKLTDDFVKLQESIQAFIESAIARQREPAPVSAADPPDAVE